VTPRAVFSGFSSSLALTSDTPVGVVVDRARGCLIYDPGGKEYLDLLSGMGVSALGHAHPRVTEAVSAQAARHLHVMVYGEYVIESQVRLASRLAGLLPAGLDKVYFTNSGTEAVEGAIKMVRKATGRSGMLAFRGAFHGDTTGAVSLGGNPLYRDPFVPLLPHCGLLEFNDTGSLKAINESTAAVFVEPVQSEAGVILPEPGFLAELAASCRAAGALLVFDEVITGLGRTGSLFALEREGVVPDVLLLAKAVGGGLPLGAFIASEELMSILSQDPPLGHVTTFGGHPLSCAAGLATLEVIIEDHLPARAAKLGDYFADALTTAMQGDGLREVRHAGLLLGLEMDSAALAEAFVAECLEERLLTGRTLHDDGLIRLAPPLIISEAELDDAVLRMQRALSRARSQPDA
jgi:acetylornithine/succinyldiaminopimelate/putrescine aminotransferase